MPLPSGNHNDGRSKKLKWTSVLGALVIILVIISFFLRFFMHPKPKGGDEEAASDDINDLAQKLFADELKHNPHLERINFQGKTKAYATNDEAPLPLLQLHANSLASDQSSTVYLMRRLFDNYELNTGVPEQVTVEEQQEELDFLNAVLKTPPMQRTMQFLQAKGKVSADQNSQLQLLKTLWFMQYSRGKGVVGSSGFEHVFLAELTDNDVKGLHNWIYFSDQEQKGNLDYKGYIQRLDLAAQEDKYLLATRFVFHNIPKNYNTLFVGTSPEFELSIYTVCFVMGMDDCVLHLGPAKVIIKTHSWNWHGQKTIASAYPATN